MKASVRIAPEECAQCGADIPPRALACPECGADERTGWREQSIYDGLDLPDEAPEPDRTAWFWRWLMGAVLSLLAALLIFRALGWP